jgi:uncharacterized cupredoxin-like copper-binding protein
MTPLNRGWTAACIFGLAVLTQQALAHGDSKKPGNQPVVKEQKPWGVAGDPKPGLRTIRFSMSDKMHFVPDHVSVKEGETVRFLVKNGGKLMHEFVIGTQEELQAHAALMKKFPKMEHDEPYMAHVAPGKTGEVIWTFNRPGDFEFACLISGHFDAGMRGTIRVVPAEASADAKRTQ